jgi:hypothetical protein
MTKPTHDMIQKAKVVMKAAAGDLRYSAAIVTLGDFFPESTGTAWLDDSDDLTIGAIFTSEEDGWLSEDEDAVFWQLVSSLDTSTQGWTVPEQFADLLTWLGASWHAESDVEQSDDLYGMLDVAAGAAAVDVCAFVKQVGFSESSDAEIVAALAYLADGEQLEEEPAGNGEGGVQR